MNWKVLICFAAVGVFAAGAASAKAHHHMGHHGKAHHEMMAKENYAPPAQPIAYGQVDSYVHPAPMEKPMPMKAMHHHGKHHAKAKAKAAAAPAT